MRPYFYSMEGSPLHEKSYGGLPESGGFRPYTEFLIGATRAAEAAHCILGSLSKALGHSDWRRGAEYEQGHITEELEIIEQTVWEYGRSTYTNQINKPTEDIRPEYHQEVIDAARNSVENIREVAPRLMQTAQENLDELMRTSEEKYIPTTIYNVAEAAYLVVIELCKSLLRAVKPWPDPIRTPYQDYSFKASVRRLKRMYLELYPDGIEWLRARRKWRYGDEMTYIDNSELPARG